MKFLDFFTVFIATNMLLTLTCLSKFILPADLDVEGINDNQTTWQKISNKTEKYVTDELPIERTFITIVGNESLFNSSAKSFYSNDNHKVPEESEKNNITQEQNKISHADLSTIPTVPTISDSWYDILVQNFTCSIQQHEGLSISCSNVSINEISQFLPADSVTVDISNCLQVVLSNSWFVHLKKLKTLTLSNNHHKYITKAAFKGLETLENLDLSKNDIMVVKYAFNYTPMLKTLNLSQNNIIRIGTIASALKNLIHFENLTLNENTRIRRISSTELEPLRNTKLTYLSIFNTTIQIIEKKAFDYLTSLKTLDLSVNYVNEVAMGNLTSSLNNTSIKFLFMRELVLLNSFPYEALKFLQNTAIFRLDLGYNNFPFVEIFPSIPSLESLWLPHCSIRLIKTNAFKHLRNLRELILNDNELTTIPFDIGNLRNLKVLFLNNQILRPRIQFTMKEFSFVNMTHLTYLSLSKIPVHDKLSRYVLSGLRNLKVLTLAAMKLTGIEEFAFETLTSLEILDIQANSLLYLRNHTFFGLKSLKILFLRRNSLKFFVGYLPFLHLPLLKELYIEYNKIDTLPGQIFSSLTNLKRLFLSKNNIVPWKSRIFHPNLTVTELELSENQVTYVTPIMLTEFSQVSEYLDLSRNPFNCSACGMKELQAFFRHSNLTFRSHSKAEMDPLTYTCEQPVFLQNYSFKDVELPVVNCEIEEAAVVSLFAVALICFITIFISLISFLCYFFRWYIRYWIFHIQARIKERKYSNSYEFHYVYDAFVSYNSENTPWVLSYLLPALEAQEPTFKLCVHERDFQVGALITENILEAIDDSRKVILVLSESFIKSEWCMFELHMAQHKLFDDIRDALILVKLENIDKKLYTKNLLYLEKTRLCLEWTENNLGQKLFWEKMRKALGLPMSKKNFKYEVVSAEKKGKDYV